jgi:hypothetical protein
MPRSNAGDPLGADCGVRAWRRVPAVIAALAAVVLGAGSLTSCGGAAKESPRSPTGAEAPTTLDEALAGLDRAEGELDSVLSRAAPPARSPSYAEPPQAGAAQPATPPAAQPPPPATTIPADAMSQPEANRLASDPCAVACRALASMGRAAEHICGLAGESDGRCGAARQRVQAASTRVRGQCSCS